MKIKLATKELQKDSIVDGEGIRAVIWTQGCRHHCPGCHNPTTHDFNKGYELDLEEVEKQIKELDGQDGITFSGGDPMEQASACAKLAEFAKKEKLNIWCYTGYTYEELIEKSKTEPEILNFLKYIDILVDGKFVLSQKSYDVPFRGSKNQRIIDVQKSLAKKETIQVSKYIEEKNTKKKPLLYV